MGGSLNQTRTSNNPVAIGETARILVNITIPQGTSYFSTLTINLPYAYGKMNVTSAKIIFFPANMNSSLAQGDGGKIISVQDNDGIYEGAVFNFGNITNYPDGVVKGVNDTIVIEVYGLMMDSSLNTNGESLASYYYWNSYNLENYLEPYVTLSMTVVTSVLEMKKTIENKNSYSTWEAGNIVQYKISITHSSLSRSDAYEILLNDTLTSYMQLIPGSVNTTSGVILKGNNETDTFVTVAPDTFSLGGEIRIFYKALLLNVSNPSSTTINSATISYYDAPTIGGQSGKHTLTATSTLLLSDAALSFSVYNSSDPGTSDASLRFTIGETITIRANLTVPQGTLPSTKVQFRVPYGTLGCLQIVGPGRIIKMDSNFNSTNYSLGSSSSISDYNRDGILDTVLFDFGVLQNFPDNISMGASDVIILEFVALVKLDDYNTNLKTMTISAILSYTNNYQGTFPTQYITITTLRPTLTISKSAVTSTTYLESGTSVYYTLTIKHGSNSVTPAYNISVVDLLKPELSLVNASVITTSGTVTTGNGNGDANITVIPNTIPSGTTVTITYHVVINNLVLSGSKVTNTANLTYSSTLNDGLYNQNDTLTVRTYDTADLAINAPVFAIAINSSTLPQTSGATVSIGEEVTWYITIDLAQGTTANATLVVNTSSSNVQLLNSAVIAMAPNVQSSTGIVQWTVGTPIDNDNDTVADSVVYNFGNILNKPEGILQGSTDKIVVEVNVLVTNKTSDSTSYHNYAYFKYSEVSLPVSKLLDLNVVEPVLKVEKTSNNPSAYMEAGLSIQYIVTITHTDLSNAPAFSLVVTDLLVPELKLQSGTVTTNSSGTVVKGNSGNDAVVKVSFPLLLKGSSIVIKFNATMTNTVQDSAHFESVVQVNYTSAPVSGVNSNNIRNYVTSHNMSLFISDPIITLEMAATSLPTTQGTDLTIGEQATIYATLILPQGVILDATYVVTLPNTSGKLKAVTGRVYNLPSHLVPTQVIHTGDLIVATDQNNDTIKDTYTFKFGNITNTPDGITKGSNDKIILEIVALVIDQKVNASNMDIEATGVLTYFNNFGNYTISTTLAITLVLPVLDLTKSYYFKTPIYPVAGKDVYYTLKLTHNGDSTASAYNITIYDNLSDRLLLNMGRVVASIGDVTINVTTGNVDGDEVVRVDVPVLNLGQTLTVLYDATLSNLVQPNTSVPNYATAVYSSALNTKNNTGSVNPFMAFANTSFVTAGPTFAFGLNSTSNPETTGTAVSIGEQVNFVSNITLTPGTTSSSKLVVSFPTSAGKIQALYGIVYYMYADLVNTTTLLQQGSRVEPSDSNGDGIADYIVFDFGNILNLPDPFDKSLEDTIIIQTYGLVIDDSTNNDGRVLSVDSAFTYSNTLVVSTLTDTKTVHVVEPRLDVVQTVNGYSYPFVEAGNVVEYNIAISHTGASTSAAYNLIVKNLFSSELTMLPHTVSCSVGCTVVQGNTDNDVALLVQPVTTALATQVVITYKATLTSAVVTNQNVASSVSLQWSSSPTNARNRTASASVNVLIAAPAVSIVLNSTSLVETPLTNVSIGEVVSLNAYLLLPQGTTNNAVLQVTVPNAIAKGYLHIVSARIAKIPSTITGSLTEGATVAARDTTGDIYMDAVSFNFGKIVNLPDGNSQDANDTIVVDVRAVVVQQTANRAGLVLASSSSVTYTGSSAFTSTSPTDAKVTVIEPSLNISKSGAPAKNVEAGDIVQYTVTIMHTDSSTAVAYNINVTDSLSTLLTLVKGSVKVPANVTVVSGNSPSDGNAVVVQLSPYLRGSAPIVFTYNATVTSLAQIGTNIPNRVDIQYYSAPLSSENTNNRRLYNTSATTYVSTPTPTLELTYVKSNPATYTYNTTVGEAITFINNITLPQGTTRSVTLVVTMPVGKLQVVLARVSFLPLNVSSSSVRPIFEQGTVINGTDTNGDSYADTVTFKLDNLVNLPHGGQKMGPNDRIVLEVVGLVQAGSYAGTSMTVSSEFTYYVDTTPFVQREEVTFTLTTMALKISKSATPTTSLQAGSVISYTVNITHPATSFGPAFDMMVVDTLSSSLGLIQDSVRVNSTWGTVIASGNVLIIHVDAFPHDVGPLVITYNVTVTYNAGIAAYIPNVVNATYYSSGPNAYNTNVRQSFLISAQASVQTLLPEMTYTLNSTSLDSTKGLQVAIGETVSIYATFFIPSGTIYNGLLTIMLPSKKQIDVKNYTIAHMPTSMSTSMNLTAGSIGTGSDNNNDFAVDKVVFNFGTIVSSPSNDNALIIEILGVISDNSVNSRYSTFVTNATFTFDNTTNVFKLDTQAVSFTVVEPTLAISKTANRTSNGESGMAVLFTITYSHSASNAEAYDVVVTETFPNQFALRNGSVTTTHGNVTLGNGNGDTSVAVLLSNLSTTAGTVRITYIGVITDRAAAATSVVTRTWVNYFSSSASPYNALDIRQYNTSDTWSVSFKPPTGTFSVLNTSISQTTNYNVAIGESIMFLFNLVLPHGTTQNVTVKLEFTNTPTKLDLKYGLVASMPPNFKSDAFYEGYVLGGNDTNYDEYNDFITFNFGNVVNSPIDAYYDAPLQILVYALVVDHIGNLNGRTIKATPTFTYALGTPITSSSAFTFTLVGPVLQITNQVTQPSVAMAGDTVTFTVTVINISPGSTSAAFDANVVDMLSNELALWPGTVNITTSAAYCRVTRGNGVNDTVVGVLCQPLPLGNTLVFNFKANLTNEVKPSSFVSNVATVSYAPYESNGESLRNISATAYVKVAVPAMTFVVANTSLNGTSGLNVAVGETVSLRATISVPMGTTPNTSIAVFLANTTQKISAVNASIYAMPSNINSSDYYVSFYDRDGDNINETVVFNFGTLMNTPNSLLGSDLVVEVVGLIIDIPANSNGKKLINSAMFTYGNGTSMFTLASVFNNVTVVEPMLNITKTASLVNGTRYETGSVVQYTLTISKNAWATSLAYDVIVNDSLSTQLALVPGSVTAPLGVVLTGNVDGDNTVAVSRAQFLVTDASLVIKYKATITIANNATTAVYNYARVGYFSSPHGMKYNAVNNREGSQTTFSTISMAQPSVTFSLHSTSLYASPSTLYVPIGDVISLYVTIKLPRGLTPSSVLSVNVAPVARLLALSGTVASMPSNINSTLVTVGSGGVLSDTDLDVDGYMDTVIFNLGDLLNVPGNNDSIVIEVLARVMSLDTNVNSQSLTNTATFTYSTPVQTITTPLGLYVGEPLITQSIVWTPTSGDAGDDLLCTVTIKHTSSSKSPALYVDVYGSVASSGYASVVVGSNTSSDASPIAPTYLGLAAPWEVISSSLRLELGATLTVTYKVRLNYTVRAADTLQFSNLVNYYSALDINLGRRGQTAVYTAGIPIKPIPSSTLKLLNTSDALTTENKVSVGEVLTFVVNVTLLEGTILSPNITVKVPFSTGYGILSITGAGIQSLPSNFEPSGYQVIFRDTNIDGLNDTVVFSFSTLINQPDNSAVNDFAVFYITMVVPNSDLNGDGQIIETSSVLTYLSSSGSQQEEAKVATVQMVQPSLVWSLTWNASLADAGDVLGCTIKIRHNASSSAVAYDIDVLAQIAPYLNFVEGSVVADSAYSVVPTVAFGWAGVARISQLLVTDNVTLSFALVVNVSVLASTNVTANLTGQYISTRSFGRNSSLSHMKSFKISPIPSSQINLTSTSNDDTNGTSVTVGEFVTLAFRMNFPEGTTLSPSMIMRMPMSAGVISLVSATLKDVPSNILFNASAFALVFSDANNDTLNDTAKITFESIVNLPDNIVNVNDSVLVEVVGLVVNANATNAPGTALIVTSNFNHSNNAKVIIGEQQSLALTIVESKLLTSITFNSSTGDAGDRLHATVTISHTGSSSAPAYNVNVTALLAPYIRILNASITSYPSSESLVATAAGWDGLVRFPKLLLGDSANVSFDAYVDDSVRASSIIAANVSLEYLTSPSNARNLAASATTKYTISPIPYSEIMLNSTSNPETLGNGVGIGEYATFHVNFTIPEGMTLSPRIMVRSWNDTAGILYIVNATLIAPASINQTSTKIEYSDYNQDSYDDTVVLTFDSLFNPPDNVVTQNDWVVFEILTLVTPSVINVDGTTFIIASSFSHSNGTNTIVEATRTAFLTMVQPALEWTVATNATTGDAGDVVGYTISISHTIASTMAAYNVEVTAVLLPYFNLINSSVIVSGPTNVGASVIPAGANSIAGVVTLHRGEIISITFSTYLDVSVQASSIVSNSITLVYSTSLTAGRNTYLNQLNSITILPKPVSTLKLLNTSNPDTPEDHVTIGELATFRLNISLPEGTTANVSIVLRTSLPAGIFSIRRVSLVYSDNITPNGYNTVFSTTIFSTDTVLVTFSSIVNLPDGVVNDRDVVHVLVDCMPMPSTPSGTTATLSSAFTHQYNNSQAVVEAAQVATVLVLQPNLVMTQVCAPATADAIDVITCNITIQATVELPTYNLVINNTWSTLLVGLVTGSVTTTNGSVVRGNGAQDTGFSVELPAFNSLNTESIKISYSVQLTDFVQSASKVNLTAVLTYLSSPTEYADIIRTNVTTSTTIASPTLAVVAATSTLSSTKDNQVAIGETMRFTATITMPEGTTLTPTIVITTPASLEITFAQVISLGNAGMCVGVTTPTYTSTTATFTFSELCNNGDNKNTVADQVVLGITTRVLNVPENQAGVTLTCQANMTFAQGSVVSGKADLVVVEPSLKITKTAGTPAMGGDFGNNITYTITVAHVSSGSYAYNLAISDVIPDSLQLIARSVTASAGTTSVSGKILSAQIPQLDLGQIYTLTYAVNLDVGTVAGTSVVNFANVTWLSLPTTVSGPSRTNSSSANATVTIGSPVLTTFSVNDTSLAETKSIAISNPATEQLAVGEEATFRVIASVPNGPMSYLYLSQQLSFQQFAVKSVTVQVGSSIRTSSLVNATQSDLIAYNFTGVNNIPDGVVNASDTVGITIVVVVRNVTANTNKLAVTTTANLESPDTKSSRALQLQIVEPQFSLSNTLQLAYPSYVEAGDVVNFTVVISHKATSGSAGYSVRFEDTLSAYYAIVPNSVTTSNGTIVKGNNAGETVEVTLPVMVLDTKVTITYKAKLTSLATANTTISSNAFVVYSSATSSAHNSGEIRTTTLLADNPRITIAAPTFQFSLNSTSLAETLTNEVAAGETINMRVSFVLPQGTTPATIVNFTLPTAVNQKLVALSGNVAFLGSTMNLVAGTQITLLDRDGDGQEDTASFNFGDITNIPDDTRAGVNDVITVELVAVVPTNNTKGAKLVANATLYYNGSVVPTQRINVTVVEAQLTVTQEVVSATATVQAGDEIQYRVKISHAASSNAPAYGIILADLLSDKFSLVLGNTTTTLGYVNNTASDVGVYPSTYLPGSAAIEITYKVILTSLVKANSTVKTNVTLSYLSALYSAVNSNYVSKRMGYTNTSLLVAAPATNLTLVSTSILETLGNKVSVGETVTLRAAVKLPQGTTPTSVLRSTITPATLSYVKASVSFLASPISSPSVTLGQLGTATDADGDGVVDSMVFTLGDLVNTPDGIQNSENDILAVEIELLVVSANASALLQSGLQFNYSSYQITSTPITLISAIPALQWTVSWNTTGGDAGDAVKGTVKISHSSNSTTAAFNVDVAALLKPHILLINDSVVSTSNGTYAPVVSSLDPIIGISVIPLNSEVTVYFSAILNVSVVTGSYVPANLSGSFSSAPSSGTIVQLPSRVSNFTIPGLSSVLTLGYKSNPESNDTINIGEYFAYYVTIHLPEGTSLQPTEVVTVPPYLADTMSLFNVTVQSVGDKVVYYNMVSEVSSSAQSTTSNDTAIVRFDSMINYPDGDTVNDFIVIAFYGVVLPTANLNNGLEVSSQLSYFNGTHTILEQGQNRSESVVTPNLNMTQICVANDEYIQAGTTFTCSLTIFAADSNAPAYNVTIGNSPSVYSVVVADSVQTSYGYKVNYGNTFGVVVAIFNPAFKFNVTVNYTVVLTDEVQSGSNITLPTALSYLSSPSSYGTLYEFLTDVPVTVAIPEASITVNATSLSAIPTKNVSVGETVSLFYTIDLIQGVTPNATLVTSFPIGLTVVKSTVVSLGNSDGCTTVSEGDSAVISDSNGDGKDDTTTFAFGELCNPADGLANEADHIVVEIVGIVEDISSNAAGVLLIANGSFAFNNQFVFTNISLLIAEPVLDWSVEWSAAEGDAGDLIACSVIVQHNSNSTAAAYNVEILSLLAPYVQLIPESVVCSLSGTPSVAIVPQSWDGISTIEKIPLGSALQLNFTVNLTSLVIAGTSILVPIASNYSSSTSYGRQASLATLYSTIAITPVPSSVLTEASTSNAETPSGQITIGEIVKSLVTITIPEGTTLSPSVQFNISSLPGVTVLSVSAEVQTNITLFNNTISTASLVGDLTTNDTATVIADSIVNLPDNLAENDVVALYFEWVVLPNTTLSAGDVIQASSQFSFSNGTSVIYELAQNISNTLLISDVQISQECVPQTSGIHADTAFLCTITVFVFNSTAPAYNLSIGIANTLYTSFVSGSATTSNGTIEEADGFTAFIPVFDPALGSNATIEYFVTLTNEVVSGLPVHFPATFSFLSSPTTYGLLTSSTTITTAIVDAPVVTMVVNATSLNATGPSSSVSVGEHISMVFTITMIEGRTVDTVLTATVSPGLSVLKSWVISMGNSNNCGELNAGSQGNLTDVDGDGALETINFTFGLLCNDADGADNNLDKIIVEAVLAVIDVPVNQPGSNVTVSGALQFSNQTITLENATLQIVQPDITFNISSNSTEVQAGSVIELTITANHTENSTAMAYDLNLITIAAPFVKFLASCDPSSQYLTATFNSDNNVSVNVPSQALNSTVQYTLCALVLSSVPTSSEFNLTFYTEYYTAPSASVPAARSFNSTSVVSHTTPALNQTIEVVSTSNFPNMTGNHNVSVGDKVTLYSTITFPAGTTYAPSLVLSMLSEDVVLQVVEVNVINYTTVMVDLNQDGNNESFALELSPSMTFETPQQIYFETVAFIVSMNEALNPPVIVNVTQKLNNTGNNETVISLAAVELFVNPLPVPTTYYITTLKNVPVIFDVVTGNSSPDQDTPDIVTSYTQAIGGVVTASNTTVYNYSTAAMAMTYIPEINFVGLDSFNYTVQNSINGVGLGTVYIQVIYMNYPPIPYPDNVTIYENTLEDIYVLDNDFDVDDELFVKSVSQAAHGNITISDDRLYVSYMPEHDWSGVDFFTYVVSDGLHEVESNVTVHVLFVNHAPEARNDSNITVYQNHSIAIDVLANDFDKDGDNLTISASTNSSNGVTYINNSRVVYTPTPGFVGNDIINYLFY